MEILIFFLIQFEAVASLLKGHPLLEAKGKINNLKSPDKETYVKEKMPSFIVKDMLTQPILEQIVHDF